MAAKKRTELQEAMVAEIGEEIFHWIEKRASHYRAEVLAGTNATVNPDAILSEFYRLYVTASEKHEESKGASSKTLASRYFENCYKNLCRDIARFRENGFSNSTLLAELVEPWSLPRPPQLSFYTDENIESVKSEEIPRTPNPKIRRIRKADRGKGRQVKRLTDLTGLWFAWFLHLKLAIYAARAAQTRKIAVDKLQLLKDGMLSLADFLDGIERQPRRIKDDEDDEDLDWNDPLISWEELDGFRLL